MTTRIYMAGEEEPWPVTAEYDEVVSRIEDAGEVAGAECGIEFETTDGEAVTVYASHVSAVKGFRWPRKDVTT